MEGRRERSVTSQSEKSLFALLSRAHSSNGDQCSATPESEAASQCQSVPVPAPKVKCAKGEDENAPAILHFFTARA
jgi:hypothetical protein